MFRSSRPAALVVMALFAALAVSACRFPVKPIVGPPPSRAGTGLCDASTVIDDAEGGPLSKKWVAVIDQSGSMIDPRNFAANAGGERGDFKMDAPGGNCSGHAAHIAGYIAPISDAHETYASLAMTFTKPYSFYDASRYSGIGFFARRGPGAFRRVRVSVLDVNTAENGKICRECSNTFGKEIEIGETWQWHVVPFADMAQRGSWGNPRPPYVAVHAVSMLFWSFESGLPGEFDLWIDDVRFVGCPGGPPAPAIQSCLAPATSANPSGTLPRTALVIPPAVLAAKASHNDCGSGVGSMLKRTFAQHVVACAPLDVGKLVQEAFLFKLRPLSSSVRAAEAGTPQDDDLVVEVPSLVVKDVSSERGDIHRYNYDLELTVTAKLKGRLAYQATTPMRIVLQFPPGDIISSAKYEAILSTQPPPAVTAMAGRIVTDIMAAIRGDSGHP